MAIADLTNWISEYGRPGYIWYAKRLAANDTLATEAHQAGPYLPKEFLFRIFPALNRPDRENPDTHFDIFIDSHAGHTTARAIWYNNKLRGGTRNESRLTGFGGRKSALLDPDSTGAIAAFAFRPQTGRKSAECHVWVCGSEVEESEIADRIGPVEPKAHVIWEPGSVAGPQLTTKSRAGEQATCTLSSSEMPPAWLRKFPTGEEIIRKTVEMRALPRSRLDDRLIKRRQCEFEIFRSVEDAFFTPRITAGFTGIAQFLETAQTILQSRKSRSGNSLELHVREIMTEEGLRDGLDFAFRPVIEGGKRPDFIFPSVTAYNNPKFPAKKLRMLGAKTTVKDRWRQVLNEADRISPKHILTLQEGVSEGQFREMREAKVVLVVPDLLHVAYPKSVRPQLLSLRNFVAGIHGLGAALPQPCAASGT